MKSLRLFIALGPAAFIKHANATIIDILEHPEVFMGMKLIGDYDFMPRNFLISDFGTIFCNIFPKICNDLVGCIIYYLFCNYLFIFLLFLYSYY